MFGFDTTRTQLSVIDKQDVSLLLGQHLNICQQVQAVIVRACARKQPNCTRHKQPQTQKHKMQDASNTRLKICQQTKRTRNRAFARKQPNCTRRKQPQTQKHKMQDARRKQHQTQKLLAAITKCLALTRHAHNLVSSKMRAHFGGQHFVANLTQTVFAVPPRVPTLDSLNGAAGLTAQQLVCSNSSCVFAQQHVK